LNKLASDGKIGCISGLYHFKLQIQEARVKFRELLSHMAETYPDIQKPTEEDLLF